MTIFKRKGKKSNSPKKDLFKKHNRNFQNNLLKGIFNKVDDSLNKALKNRDLDLLKKTLNTVYEVWDDKELYYTYDDEYHYPQEPEIIQKILVVENYYVILKYYPVTHKIPNNRIDFKTIVPEIIAKLCIGIDYNEEDHTHKEAYVSYLEEELVVLEGLLSFDPKYKMTGLRLAKKIHNYILKKIVRENKLIEDPSQILHDISLKFDLQMVNLGILLELMHQYNILKNTKTITRCLASEFFYNSHEMLAGKSSLKDCMGMANSKDPQIKDIVNQGKNFLKALKALKTEKP